MKLFLITIGLCAVLMGCASAKDDEPNHKTYVNDYSPPSGGGGGYYNPCGQVYVLEIKTDAGTFRKEVPVYCNPNADEYYGDPPDYRINPWDTQTTPPQYQTGEYASNAR